MSIRKSLATFGVIALTVAACGGSRDSTSPDTTPTSPPATAAPTSAETPTPTEAPATGDTQPVATEAPTTTEAPGETFGDLPWPCGQGDGANADDGSEVGVTSDSVTIGTGDDAGFASSPGLNHEQVDAVKAMVTKCNELGGINGRQLKLNYYDAKLFEVTTAMQSACDDGNFFLVGEGWAFDSQQEEIRLGCKLPAAPTYTVSAAFAHGDLMYQGVPNPSDETPVAGFIQFAKLLPDAVKGVGVLAANFSATTETRDKYVAVTPSLGWSYNTTDLVHNPTGEADWTPFVKQLQDAKITMLQFVGSCVPNLQQMAATMKTNGLTVPILSDSNMYETRCAEGNTDGSLDNLYMRFAYVPFEEASANKATQDYLDLLAANGGDTALLGLQATSSFMLWAKSASECGATLTRACTLENMKNTHDWTGGGLHAPADPGGNHPPLCGALLKMTGTTYERVTPTEPASFDCGDANVVKVEGTPALVAAALDENRISRQFTPAG